MYSRTVYESRMTLNEYFFFEFFLNNHSHDSYKTVYDFIIFKLIKEELIKTLFNQFTVQK